MQRRHRRHRARRLDRDACATRSSAVGGSRGAGDALRDADGAEVARATGATGELTVDGVHPWQPGEGHLYELAVELWGDGDAPVDAYPLPVGIRTVAVRRHASS